MGCSASRSYDFVSKDQEKNPSSNTFPSPVSRALSLPTSLVHHPAVCEGDTDHLVSLVSTTYGSLVMIDTPKPKSNVLDFGNTTGKAMKVEELGNSGDPSSPDSVINTWELMEGLDEVESVDVTHYIVDSSSQKVKEKLFSFGKSNTLDNCYLNKDYDANELLKTYEIVEHSDSKPLWQHLSEESLLGKLYSNVDYSHVKPALLAKQSGSIKIESKEQREPELINHTIESSNLNSLSSKDEIFLPDAKDRIVIYYTSLRGIRRTYEECCDVRMIFRGLSVSVDERDVSMDSSYRKDLKDALGGKAASLPQVFIRGKYIGGAEEIKQLHEVGALVKLLDGIPTDNVGLACQSCGDARFVPCPNCNGSRKIYEEDEGKLKRCPDCNENGLIRCLVCSP